VVVVVVMVVVWPLPSLEILLMKSPLP